MRPNYRLHIYRSWAHILAMLAVLLLPLAALVIVSRTAGVSVDRLGGDLASSLWRMAVAYVLAAVLGWFLAVVFASGKRANIALPIFDVLQSFPVFAILPAAVLIWGPNNFVIIAFLTEAVIWPLFFSVVSSLRLIRRDWQEAVQIYGLKGWNYLDAYLIPATLPGFITGSVIGMGDAWQALIATEILVGIKSGVGPFFDAYSRNGTVTALGIFAFLTIIFAINKLVWLPLLELSHRTLEE